MTEQPEQYTFEFHREKAEILRGGDELTCTDVVVDAATIDRLVEQVVAPLGLRADRTAPLVDARLADGSRVHVALPPLAVDGPYVTIRRFRPRRVTLAEVAPPDLEALLIAAVADRANIVVSGGSGAGKTTLLNALGAHIPGSQRIVTVEDVAELSLPGDHVLHLEARPANAEAVGAVTIRDLVRNALRMRPDRLVVGEVRASLNLAPSQLGKRHLLHGTIWHRRNLLH